MPNGGTRTGVEVTAMREIFAAIADRIEGHHPCAVATLVAAYDATPAPLGTSLVVDRDGTFLGNIGAGCHEAAIIEGAQRALRNGLPGALTFDLKDDVLDGSVCGAKLEVVVWIPDAQFCGTARAIALGEQRVRYRLLTYDLDIAPRKKLIVVGATSLGAELALFARRLDFRTTLVDPRAAFATRERHAVADEILVRWPQDVLPGLLGPDVYVAIVAHDAKIDLPAIRCALQSQTPYIGVIGNRRTQEARATILAGEGYDAASLERVHGPAGLDLGGDTNAQIALSILAEIVAVENQRSGLPLRSTQGRIHRS